MTRFALNIKICFPDDFIERQPILFTSITPKGAEEGPVCQDQR